MIIPEEKQGNYDIPLVPTFNNTNFVLEANLVLHETES
jgi:hypothetical protein